MEQVQDFPQVQTEIRNLKHMVKSIEVKIDTTFQRQAENQGEYTKGNNVEFTVIMQLPFTKTTQAL